MRCRVHSPTTAGRLLVTTAIVWLVLVAPIGVVWAQQPAPTGSAAPQVEPSTPGVLDRQVARLDSRVDQLESSRDRSSTAGIAFLFGAFCALWAQNTKRNPWAWFFLGAFFNVITVLVLLAKNREEPDASSGLGPAVIAAILFGGLLLASLLWYLLRSAPG